MKIQSRKSLYLIPITFYLLTTSLFGQSLSTANSHFDLGDYRKAAEIYEKILDKDKKNREATLKLAECYVWLNAPGKARVRYAQAARFQDVDPQVYFEYGRVLMSCRKYEQAIPWFEKYLETHPQDGPANQMIAACRNMESFTEERAFFQLIRLPLNTENAEFGPSIWEDNLVFASNRKGGTGKKDHRGEQVFSLFASPLKMKDKPVLGEVVPFRKGDGSAHEANASFSDDGTQMFFTGNAQGVQTDEDDEYAVANLAIFLREKTETGWSEAELLPFNDPAYSFGHPCLSPDGERLFFVSNKKGGRGETDIYFSEWSGNNWGEPVNLGELNTSGAEMFPWIDPDGNIYFASNGLGGLGGLDIFKAEKTDEGFATPQNLGAPVNGPADDFALIYDPGAGIGFFSSNRPGGKGQDDIYAFKKLISFYGLVKNDAGEGVKDARVTLRLGKGRIRVKTDESGKFTAGLVPEQTYTVSILAEGYIPFEADLSTLGLHPEDAKVLPFVLEPDPDEK